MSRRSAAMRRTRREAERRYGVGGTRQVETARHNLAGRTAPGRPRIFQEYRELVVPGDLIQDSSGVWDEVHSVDHRFGGSIVALVNRPGYVTILVAPTHDVAR